MSAASERSQDPKVRIGLSTNSNLRHVIDEWAPEIVRRRNTVALCGAKVRPLRPGDEADRFCKKCELTIHQHVRDMYNRRNNPPDEAVKECMELLMEETTPKLAKVIPLLPRQSSL